MPPYTLFLVLLWYKYRDYRGEVCVGLVNQCSEPFTINPGDRIAQLVIAPVILPEIVEVDELSDTDRGSGGFGSTGIS